MQLGGLSAVAIALAAAIVGSAFAGSDARDFRLLIASDTLISPDSLANDTLLADSIEADTIPHRANYYVPGVYGGSLMASPRPRQQRPFSARIGGYWRDELELDSTQLLYRAREYVGDLEVRIPRTMDLPVYRGVRLDEDMLANWEELVEARARARRQQRRGGFGFNIVIPGGQQSAFTTIFGRPEVDLRVNGQAVINAGFDYRRSDQQIALTGSPSQFDPQFKQDLRLGITGSIGDKLRVDVNWDTNNQFDYQNQLKLQYTGYEDEIIQSIEAGNVMLQTPSRLIRGGQSLFGIKSRLQLGNLSLTTVASQQEGQSNTLALDGGAQTTEFNLRASDYDESRHYFLGYYYRNNWERSLSSPPTPIVFDGFEGIETIEVWKLQGFLNPEDENVRQAVALIDLGESEQMLAATPEVRDNLRTLPSNEQDQYSGQIREELRRRDNLASYLENSPDLSQTLRSTDYQIGTFKLLSPSRDYQIDRALGYLSLTQSLNDNEAIAVAYRYRAGGRTFSVGEFSTETGGGGSSQTSDRIILKLLRPAEPKTPADDGSRDPASWYLEMRNIYRLPGRGITSDDFELEVQYNPPGQTASTTIPRLSGSRTMIQLLGLDRLNQDGSPSPDNRFDFLTGYTIDPSSGRLIFPFLEPFGDHMEGIIEELAPEEDQSELKDDLVYRDLYTRKRDIAQRNTRQDVYAIRGSYRGSVQDFYNLEAWAGLIEGSVRVTAGGVPLQEGSDFTVDYQGGTVTIINPAFLTSGRNIEINYEQNSLFNLQKKTLLGVRADYVLGENVTLGSTLMRLSQKSPVDKYRIGEEPISNTIYGFDGAMQFEPEWLTRAIDRLPLIQTRAPSSVSFSGEFAQLRPGATQTTAFQRTRRELRNDGMDFKEDELRGVSFIDDFEGFANTLSLRSPAMWRLASAPLSTRPYGPEMSGAQFDSLRTTLRGMMGWYQLNANIVQSLGSDVNDPVTGLVPTRDVFPTRETGSIAENTIQTLDVYFDPRERGPYNYNGSLLNFMSAPEDNFGAMIQRIPEGYADFSKQNIEFIEFIFQPHSEGGDAGEEAELIFDLGLISEDIIPNGRLNSEDGLSTTSVNPQAIDAWGRIPTGNQNNAVDVNTETQRTEDLGLDGLVSYSNEAYPEELTEQFHFRDFLASVEAEVGDELHRAEVEKALLDPSGDDYRYYEDPFYDNPTYFPGGATLQQRFTRYFAGQELNALETQRLANDAGRRGNSRLPDTEDLNMNGTLDTENSYYEYRVPLSRARLEAMAEAERQPGDYIIEKVGASQDWYLVRIPVTQYTNRIGDIQDFSLIRAIRLWTTGHTSPVTMRFARLDLVGSQWQKAENVLFEEEHNPDQIETDTRFAIESINDEENTNSYRPPPGVIINQTRGADGVARNQREQAMLLRLENFRPGAQRAVFRPYRQGMDLLKYSNVRMYVHMHGNTPLGPIDTRDELKIFVRLGSNESTDFYEYEQPLSPSPPGVIEPNALWQTNQMVDGRVRDLNSVNIVLAALNQLKVARDLDNGRLDAIYWSDVHDVSLSPNIDDFAPPGTRLGIKGNPSLGRVNSIVIGVRSPEGSQVIETAEVWVNELRVTGYDESNGWSALANADIRLADVATIRATFQRQTDGFGSLESSLGERDQNAINNWSINTDFNAHKLLPERFGWSLPVSMQFQSNTSLPRFSPARGDVRVQELVNQIEERDDLSDEQRRDEVREVIESAETHNARRSFSARAQKQGSDSWLLRNTVDAVSVSYSYSDQEARSPSRRLDNNWQWSTSATYRLQSRRARTIKPFWFMGDIPVIGFLGDLDFAYLPQSISLTGSARRSFGESRDRSRELRQVENPVPDIVRYPLRQQHSFGHDRGATIQYNPFRFLNLSYDANTRQSLNALGIQDTLITRHEISEHETAETSELVLRSFDSVVMRMLSGDPLLRTDSYNQRFTGTLRPNLSNTKALDFVNVQDIVYNARFTWQNGPIANNRGARVSNQVEIRGGITLRPQELWRKFSFYRDLEDAQREFEREKQARRRQRQAAPPPRVESDTTAVETEEREPRPPLIDPGSLLRRTILAITGMRDFNVNYTGTLSSTATNVGTDVHGDLSDIDVSYSLWQALRGNGPSLGYRFGLERSIPMDQRILDPSVQVTDVLRDNHRIQGRTTIAPSNNLQINLTWNGEWEESENYSYRRFEDPSIAETGRNRSSIWVFGADYLTMFERQLRTFENDRAAAPGVSVLPDADGDGRVVLSNSSVVEDFRQAFMKNFGTVDGRGLMPFPMPGWNVNYSGFGNWPIIRALVQSATLRHGYSADYSTDFRANQQADELHIFPLVSNLQIQYEIPRYEVGGIRINERYQPMIGVDLNFRNRLSTQIAWSKSNLYSLSTSNLSVSESKTNELTLSANYQKQGLSIPFLPGRRLNNRIGLTLSFTRSFTQDQRYALDRAIRAAASNPDFVLEDAVSGDFVNLITGATRTTIAPQISYQFSNRVNANFTLRYEQFDSEDSRQPSSTNISGGFNVRVNIAN